MHPPRAARLAATIYYGSLRGLGLTALERRFRDAGVILCYHNVVPAVDAGAGDPGLHMPRERFEQQMRWLRDHYQVVSLREFVDRVTAGRSLRSMAAVTFDDGYAGVFEHCDRAGKHLAASGGAERLDHGLRRGGLARASNGRLGCCDRIHPTPPAYFARAIAGGDLPSASSGGRAHSHEFSMAVYGAWASWRAGIPHVITMHGGRYYAGRLRRRLALRAAIALSERTVAVSTTDAEDAEAFCRLISPARLERLEREGGVCIVATHFGKGFVRNGRVCGRLSGASGSAGPPIGLVHDRGRAARLDACRAT